MIEEDSYYGLATEDLEAFIIVTGSTTHNEVRLVPSLHFIGLPESNIMSSPGLSYNELVGFSVLRLLVALLRRFFLFPCRDQLSHNGLSFLHSLVRHGIKHLFRSISLSSFFSIDGNFLLYA